MEFYRKFALNSLYLICTLYLKLLLTEVAMLYLVHVLLTDFHNVKFELCGHVVACHSNQILEGDSLQYWLQYCMGILIYCSQEPMGLCQYRNARLGGVQE